MEPSPEAAPDSDPAAPAEESPSQEPPATRWLVDASNVIGCRPDGWWNDPQKADRRFLDELSAYADQTGEDVTVIFDRRPPEVAPGRQGGVTVGFASHRGPNAADDEIVKLVAADDDRSHFRVVTSDRRLRERVQELGAPVNGAMNFRRRLDQVLGTGRR